jgi:transcriptional regulator with GAF, ATPase, and Fis domain
MQTALAEIEQLKNRLEAENLYLRDQIDIEQKHEEIIGQSVAIRKVLLQVEQVANTDATVLLLGETGTGKELLARAIHNLSGRKARAMIKLNCAALPSTLIEAELFGREKGAYTGAMATQIGRFEAANGSTIFLDEIGEIPLDLQAKLLRVLQEGQLERLGSPQPIEVDVRIIAATNRDLSKAVKEGRFREDLYYRLNVFPISVPPLRDRREDISLLVWAIVKEFGSVFGKTIERIPKKNMEALERYLWPGNIRELRNMIERAMILSNSSTLVVDLPDNSPTSTSQTMSLEEMERMHIVSIMERTGWRVRGKNGAAEVLGLKPTTLDSKMRKLGIKRTAGRYEIS